MDHETEERPFTPDDLPFDLDDQLGEVRVADWECPGVYYLAARDDWENLPFCREYYVVEQNSPIISDKVKARGQVVPRHPGLRLFPWSERLSGWEIVRYEVYRYRAMHELPLPDGVTLHSVAVFAAELHPEYFGAFPVPYVTPWGYTLRNKAIHNGVYWLETTQCVQALAVCYPMAEELSDYAKGLSRPAEYDEKQGIDNTLGYYFFSAADSCVPLFELGTLRPEWAASGMLDGPALMNAIWTDHPRYAAGYNLQEQSGLHDGLRLLLNMMGADEEPSGRRDRMITLSERAGTELSRFWPKDNIRKENLFMGLEGMTRKMDELGRLVTPIEFRRALNWKEGSNITMYPFGDCILLQSPEQLPECYVDYNPQTNPVVCKIVKELKNLSAKDQMLVLSLVQRFRKIA